MLSSVDDAVVVGGNDRWKIGGGKTSASLGTHQQLLGELKLLISVYAAVAAVDNKGVPFNESGLVLLKQNGHSPNRVKLFRAAALAGQEF